MSEPIPDDLRENALAVVNRGYDEGLVDAVAAALLSERNTTLERCVKVAEATLIELELRGDAEYLATAIRQHIG